VKTAWHRVTVNRSRPEVHDEYSNGAVVRSKHQG
jgi:hypothetical protein